LKQRWERPKNDRMLNAVAVGFWQIAVGQLVASTGWIRHRKRNYADCQSGHLTWSWGARAAFRAVVAVERSVIRHFSNSPTAQPKVSLGLL